MEIRARHVRYRRLERLRHSPRFNRWLDNQATRLSITKSEVFGLLANGASAAEVENILPEEGGPSEWNGALRNIMLATTGDSLVSNGTSSAGTESHGFNTQALRLCGQRLYYPLSNNFGVGGETSVQVTARFATVLATGAGVVMYSAGTNDRGSAALTADQTLAAMHEAKQMAFAAETVIVFCVPAPRGNPTYPGNTLSGQQLANHLEVRTRMLSELPGVGCLVVDTYPALLRPASTQAEIRDDASVDGLHVNTNGATLWGEVLATAYSTIAPALDVVPVTQSPGAVSTNAQMAGTGGSGGGTSSGEVADGYSGANATGTTAVSRTYSKVAKEGKIWQQCVIGGGAATANAAIDILRQIGLETSMVDGQTYEVVAQYEIDAGMTNVLSLQLGFQYNNGSTVSLWDGDRYTNDSPLPSVAQAGVMRTPPFVFQQGVTDVRMRCSCYMRTSGAPTGTVRITGMEMRPVSN